MFLLYNACLVNSSLWISICKKIELENVCLVLDLHLWKNAEIEFVNGFLLCFGSEIDTRIRQLQ